MVTGHDSACLLVTGERNCAPSTSLEGDDNGGFVVTWTLHPCSFRDVIVLCADARAVTKLSGNLNVRRSLRDSESPNST